MGNGFRILTPLFKNNQVERIKIYGCNLGPEGIGLLATSLAMFDSLKEFALTHAFIDYQQAARDLVQSLSCHSGLRKLDLSSTEVGKHGCSSLVNMLSNPNTSLRVLDLTSNRLGDTEALTLARGLADNTTLKEINLSSNWGITQAVWQALFDHLSSSSCRLERLSLQSNEINDAAAQSLSTALTSNTTLKTLNLSSNRGIGQAGWQALFDHLSSSSCRLEKLSLNGNYINDAVAQSLSNALASNTTLKILDLGCTGSFTIAGWRILFGSLRSLDCALEELDLSDNQLNDEVMTSLTDALDNNRSLKSLNLNDNGKVTGATWQIFFSTVLGNPSLGLERLHLEYCNNIDDAIRALANALVNNSKLKVLSCSQYSDTGWETFGAVFESPYSALEELDLQGNDINDATCTALLNSLAGNKKLKELLFYHSDDWEPNLGVLCNADSILSTYNSNHTLEALGKGDRYLPDDLVYLLNINRENSPRQAARFKITKTHFNEGFITQPFFDMDLNVLPYAMAWMGRDGEVDGPYFSFIKSMSSLIENAN